MGCTVGYNYMRGEFEREPFEHFELALKDAYANNWLGKNIQGTEFSFDIFHSSKQNDEKLVGNIIKGFNLVTVDKEAPNGSKCLNFLISCLKPFLNGI